MHHKNDNHCLIQMAFTRKLRLILMQGVDAIVQLKSSLPISAKVEINPKGFILGIKAKIEKIFLICPQVTNKC